MPNIAELRYSDEVWKQAYKEWLSNPHTDMSKIKARLGIRHNKTVRSHFIRLFGEHATDRKRKSLIRTILGDYPELPFEQALLLGDSLTRYYTDRQLKNMSNRGYKTAGYDGGNRSNEGRRLIEYHNSLKHYDDPWDQFEEEDTPLNGAFLRYFLDTVCLILRIHLILNGIEVQDV